MNLRWGIIKTSLTAHAYDHEQPVHPVSKIVTPLCNRYQRPFGDIRWIDYDPRGYKRRGKIEACWRCCEKIQKQKGETT